MQSLDFTIFNESVREIIIDYQDTRKVAREYELYI